MVLAYRLSGQLRYLTSAISLVDEFVTEGEAAIAAGGTPAIAGDSHSTSATSSKISRSPSTMVSIS